MKNRIKIILIALGLVTFSISCSDWTETESLEIIESDIEKDDPKLYAKYLKNLREYKDSEHKIVYFWFDNSKDAPKSRGEQITAIPDSVDVVNLMNPDELSSAIIADMEKVRDEKGMKFIFTIDHLALQEEYEQYVAHITGSKGEEEPTDIESFSMYSTRFVANKLALVPKYKYDGISVRFNGKLTHHLTEKEKIKYLEEESAFMSQITEWVNKNPNMLFVFEGFPQNLTDKSILQKTSFIAIRSENVRYLTKLNYEVLQTIGSGVPTDRYVITVSARSLDQQDTKTGYIIDSDNQPVLSTLIGSEWVDTYELGFKKVGLAIINAQNDYYNPAGSYKEIRRAISIMNLSPKY